MMTDRERDYEMIVIGIADSTGPGRTTVARKIVEALPPNYVTAVPLDSYYNDTSEMTEEERHATNLNRPDVFDWELLVKQVSELREGGPIGQPTCSYLKCNRLPETVHMEPRPVIIIEGIMTLLNKRLREMTDLRVFVDCNPDERLIRNIQRDTIERGRDVDMVVQRYLDVPKLMCEQFVEPTKRFADMITPQGGENLKGIDIFYKYVEYLVLMDLS